jgi:uncharacterized protein (DUF2267 family)
MTAVDSPHFKSPDHQYERFITTVAQQADLGWEDAERAARATLETLAERLSSGEARDIAEHLPPQIRAWLPAIGGAEPFHADEFVRRVAEREGVDPQAAERHVRAVFVALGRFLPRQELSDMAAELAEDYGPLLEGIEPAPAQVMPIEGFLRRVADHAAIDEARARPVTEAVLETLAERISGGEVEDLAAQLPVELRPALERGNALSHGAARRMSLDEFVTRVAEREGVTPDEARDHVRAVFLTLREAVSEKEIADLEAQLPKEYAAVLARA